jgi:glycosyltransferase involved in cell wall biosynthesis
MTSSKQITEQTEQRITHTHYTAQQVVERSLGMRQDIPEQNASVQQDIQYPLVSIIVPVLNEESLVEQTLSVFDAVRNIFPIEIIVSDGGSHDRTRAIAEKYADRVICHTEHRKQTIAEGRNRGAERARGDILVFINGDTLPADSSAFMRTIMQWSSHSTEAALACPVHIAPHERRLADTLFHSFYNGYVRFLNMVGFGMGRGECQVVRRSVFATVGGYNHCLVAGEDFDLFRRVRRHGRIGWHSAMTVYESPRRFRKYGYGYVLWTWTVNALSVMIAGKAISHHWEEVR